MSAPALRWSLTRLNTAAATVVPFTLASDALVDDVLVASVTARDPASAVSGPDGTWLGPLPATAPRTGSTSGSIAQFVFVKRVTAPIAAGTVFNFTAGIARVRAGILSCWSGLAALPAAPQIVAGGQANASGTPMPFPSVTPFATSGLLMTLGGGGNVGLSVTPAAGTTEIGDGVTATGSSDLLTFAGYQALTGLTGAPLAPLTATLAAASPSAAVALFLPDTDAAAINRPPAASAGTDQWVKSDATVTLNGTGSADPDSNPLTYAWTQVSGPPVTLSSATVPQPTFPAPRFNGQLVFQLTVSDGQLQSTDQVTVAVRHAPFGLLRRPGGSVPVFD